MTLPADLAALRDKLLELDAQYSADGLPINEYCDIAVDIICSYDALLADKDAKLKVAGEVLEMLSKRPIATWYGTLAPDKNHVGGGYYAGWDDAEYAVKQALALIAAEKGSEL